MASTYTNVLKLELQATGENSNTWGTKNNTVISLIEDSIANMATIATTGGTTTLTTTNAATNESRMAVLKITGVLVSNATIVIPAYTKQYLVWNATTGAYTVTVKVTGQTGAEVTQGYRAKLFCDGTVTYHATTELVAPALGTPASIILTNATGLPVSSGISGLGANVAAFLATPSSANLAAAVTDETGTGTIVFTNSPTLVTPTLGVATATSINKITFTQPATGATVTITDGKTLAATHSLTLAGTDGTTMTFPAASTTVAGLGTVQTFTKAQLIQPDSDVAGLTVRGHVGATANAFQVQNAAGTGLFYVNGAGHIITEGVTATGATGTGKLVFDTSPTLITPALGTPSALVGTNITGTAAGLTAGTATTATNIAGGVIGNVVYQSAAGVTALLTNGPAGTALVSGGVGVIPAWTALAGTGTVTNVTWTGGIVSIANPTSVAAFTIAGTSGGVPYFDSATTWATSAALAANAIVLGGGAGVAPATTTTGTGVVTALGVNVGTAGAVVVNGGALGTPSSGTLTNATGLPATGVTGTALVAAAIGTTVQAYDADLTTWAGITPGANVGTALAVAVGTDGAFVVKGGALGTPSSGNLANCTGAGISFGKAIAAALVFGG